ncbi:MAG: alpha-glucosidase [Chloroflexi bacterium]|nr:alpha-glucosidase [Chloroflexota bacterium]
MKRKTTLVLLIMVLGLLIGLPRVDGSGPVAGTLVTELASEAYSSGAFSLAWDGESQQLTITHADEPARVLWATVPGEAFVAAGRGEEQVTDSRGHYTIEDSRLVVCSEQTLDAIVQDELQVQLSGTLRCDNGSEVPYELRFAAQSNNQLGFELSIDDPTMNRTYLTYGSHADEHFFGFGVQYSFFDFKGKRLPIFVSEQGIGRGAQPVTAGANAQAGAGGTWYMTYAGIPHYISSDLHSLFLESYAYAVFDMQQDDRVQVELFTNQMPGRIIYGATPADLITEYTGTIGRMRPLPEWITSGAVVGMQGGTERVREVYQQLRDYDVPVAAFWLQDWVGNRITSFGSQLWWNWELDTERYPEWEALVADLNADDVQVMTYISPYLADVSEKPNHRRNLYQEAAENGYFVKNQDGDPYAIQTTDFDASLIDFTNPEAWNWYMQVVSEQVVGAGVTGWMADYGEALPYDAVLYSDDPAARMHNRYPELWASFNQAVIQENGLAEEGVFFMRSGYRASPHYTTLFWLGDQLVDWHEHDGIKTAVVGLLTSGLSGYSFNHSDIGGYTTITHPVMDIHRSEELLLRWMELNAFTSVFRTHEGNQPEQNVQFYSNDTTLSHFARFAQVYNAWEFYRRELIEEAATTGLPVVRHPFIHYPDDPAVYELSYQQFMVGTELMVAPVLDPETTSVEVYLPAGEWVHVWTGETYGDPAAGTRVEVAAPLGQPAVFYPVGSEVGEQFVENLRADGLLDE